MTTNANKGVIEKSTLDAVLTADETTSTSSYESDIDSERER
jgi:hypothetical protein